MSESMFRIYIRIVLPIVLAILAIPDLILGLRDVSVTVPTAVKRGDDVLLVCNYDMENDTLYSVKWYKGRREFYRYTPKENPAMKMFPITGVTVKIMASNQSHVMLTNVQLNLSGKFSCEVSADAPSFHTTIVSGNMEVVELPEQRPIITGIHSRYRMGDLINGNCSTEYSKPATNLTWTINGIQVMPNQVKSTVQKNPLDNLEASFSEVSFIVNHLHFIHGRLKLKCSARIHNIYHQETEKIIEEDRPRILASGRSPEMNNLYPFDQQSDGEFPDPNEYYYKGAQDTSSATSILLGQQYDFEISSIFTSKNQTSYKLTLIISKILQKFGLLLISILVCTFFSIINLRNGLLLSNSTHTTSTALNNNKLQYNLYVNNNKINSNINHISYKIKSSINSCTPIQSIMYNHLTSSQQPNRQQQMQQQEQTQVNRTAFPAISVAS